MTVSDEFFRFKNRMQGFGSAASPSNSFPTTWPNTENPISQGAIWTQGGAVGLDWQNPQTTGGTPGIAFGTGDSPVHASDSIATVQGLFTTNKHYSRVTLKLQAGYTPTDSHECEALVGFTIAANNAKGYEVTCGTNTLGNFISVDVVRWNGALDNFSTFGVWGTTTAGGTFTPANLDDIRVEYDSTSGSPIITIYENGVSKWVVTDTTAGKITSGSPGIGFFTRAAGADRNKYAISGFDAGNF